MLASHDAIVDSTARDRRVTFLQPPTAPRRLFFNECALLMKLIKWDYQEESIFRIWLCSPDNEISPQSLSVCHKLKRPVL